MLYYRACINLASVEASDLGGGGVLMKAVLGVVFCVLSLVQFAILVEYNGDYLCFFRVPGRFLPLLLRWSCRSDLLGWPGLGLFDDLK